MTIYAVKVRDTSGGTVTIRGAHRTTMQRKRHSIDTGGDQLMQLNEGGNRRRVTIPWVGGRRHALNSGTRGVGLASNHAADFGEILSRAALHRRARMALGASLISLHECCGARVENPLL